MKIRKKGIIQKITHLNL